MAEGGYLIDNMSEDNTAQHNKVENTRKSQDLYSDDVPDTWCDPCHDGGIYRSVYEYCPVCIEFYCTDCGKAHNRLALTKTHETVKGTEIPQSQAAKRLNYEPCVLHPGYYLDRFCSSHKMLLCSRCIAEHHTLCDIKTISEASKVVDKNKIVKFKDLILDVKNAVLPVKLFTENNIHDMEKQRLSALNKAKQMRDEEVTRINEMYEESEKQIGETYDKMKNSLSVQISTLDKVLTSVDQSLVKLQKCQAVGPKTFLTIQEIVRITKEDINNANEISRTLRQFSLTFTPDQQYQQYVSKLSSLGNVETLSSEYLPLKSFPIVTFPIQPSKSASNVSSLSDIKLHHLEPFSVKISEDLENCNVLGLDMTPDGRIILADESNARIKMLSSEKKHQSALSLRYPPCDVAVINNEEAIVCLLHPNQLYILNIQAAAKPSIKQTIKLNYSVCAVTAYQDKIFASSWSLPRSIKLIDRSGQVYWSRSLGIPGQTLLAHLFDPPVHNTCYLENNRLIVIISDHRNQTITKVDGDTGDVIKVNALSAKGPTGISIDSRSNLYVCYRDSHELCAWTSDMGCYRILLSTRDGLDEYPWCVKYNDCNRQLLVSYSSRSKARNRFDCYNVE